MKCVRPLWLLILCSFKLEVGTFSNLRSPSNDSYKFSDNLSDTIETSKLVIVCNMATNKMSQSTDISTTTNITTGNDNETISNYHSKLEKQLDVSLDLPASSIKNSRTPNRLDMPAPESLADISNRELNIEEAGAIQILLSLKQNLIFLESLSSLQNSFESNRLSESSSAFNDFPPSTQSNQRVPVFCNRPYIKTSDFWIMIAPWLGFSDKQRLLIAFVRDAENFSRLLMAGAVPSASLISWFVQDTTNFTFDEKIEHLNEILSKFSKTCNSNINAIPRSFIIKVYQHFEDGLPNKLADSVSKFFHRSDLQLLLIEGSSYPPILNANSLTDEYLNWLDLMAEAGEWDLIAVVEPLILEVEDKDSGNFVRIDPNILYFLEKNNIGLISNLPLDKSLERNHFQHEVLGQPDDISLGNGRGYFSNISLDKLMDDLIQTRIANLLYITDQDKLKAKKFIKKFLDSMQGSEDYSEFTATSIWYIRYMFKPYGLSTMASILSTTFLKKLLCRINQDQLTILVFLYCLDIGFLKSSAKTHDFMANESKMLAFRILIDKIISVQNSFRHHKIIDLMYVMAPISWSRRLFCSLMSINFRINFLNYLIFKDINIVLDIFRVENFDINRLVQSFASILGYKKLSDYFSDQDLFRNFARINPENFQFLVKNLDFGKVLFTYLCDDASLFRIIFRKLTLFYLWKETRNDGRINFLNEKEVAFSSKTLSRLNHEPNNQNDTFLTRTSQRIDSPTLELQSSFLGTDDHLCLGYKNVVNGLSQLDWKILFEVNNLLGLLDPLSITSGLDRQFLENSIINCMMIMLRETSSS